MKRSVIVAISLAITVLCSSCTHSQIIAQPPSDVVSAFEPVTQQEAASTEHLHKAFYANGNVKHEALTNSQGGYRVIKYFAENDTPKEGREREGLDERLYSNGLLVALNEYYPNGNIKFEGLVTTNNEVLLQMEFDDNGHAKNGVFRETFINGNYVESTYRNGRKDGIERRYEHGSLLIENVWIDGVWEYEKVLTTNGLVKRIRWFRNGREQTRKDFLDDGSLDCIRTTDGVGEEFRRYRDGRLWIEYRGTQYTCFYPDGSVWETGNYDGHGQHQGIQRHFDQAGHVSEEEMWSHGQRAGTNRLFYSSGKLKCEAFCDQGHFVRGTCYREDGSVVYEGKDEDRFVEETGLEEWFHSISELVNPRAR